MTGPAEPRVLADVGGLVIAERGPLVLVVDRDTGSLATAAFVSGVLALVVGGFGAVTLAPMSIGGAGLPWWLGVTFLLVGVALAVAASGLVRRIGRARAVPVSGYRPVVIFDRASRVVTDADGDVLAPLDQVRFEQRTQLASSSAMLVVVTPSGARILKRGNPFNGGLGNLETVLTAAVFAPLR